MRFSDVICIFVAENDERYSRLKTIYIRKRIEENELNRTAMLSFLMYISVLMSVEVLVKVSFGAFLFPVCKSHHAEELLFINEINGAASAVCLDNGRGFNMLSGRGNGFICMESIDIHSQLSVFQKCNVST